MEIIEEELQHLSNANEPSLQPPSSPQSASNRKHLPTEIIVEILLKLPVESLLRCKSVCKLWFSLISDPHFVKSHLNLSAHRRLIFSIFSIFRTNIIKTCCVDDVTMAADNIINNNGLEVVDFPLKTESKYVRLIGSCNGLLCLLLQEDPPILCIWNPSTRIYHKLPSDCDRTTHFVVSCGFGYDESTDNYKVVIAFRETAKMYSLRNGGWRDIGAFPILYAYGYGSPIGTFLNGAIHWCGSNGWAIVIVSLDLATEAYGEVVQPVYDEGRKELTLGTLGEWLCLMCDYFEGRVDLWAMQVYGVKESWNKLFSFLYTQNIHIARYLTPLCISSNGKILFIFGTKLMIYDSNSSSFSDVQNFDKYVGAYTFYESLISPLPPAAALEHRVASSNLVSMFPLSKKFGGVFLDTGFYRVLFSPEKRYFMFTFMLSFFALFLFGRLL